MKIQWSWRTSRVRLSPSHVQQFRCIWHSQSHNFTNHCSHTQSTSTDDWYLCASVHNWVFSPTSIWCLSCFLSNWCRVYRCGSGPDCLDIPIPTSAPSARETLSTFTHPSFSAKPEVRNAHLKGFWGSQHDFTHSVSKSVLWGGWAPKKHVALINAH